MRRLPETAMSNPYSSDSADKIEPRSDYLTHDQMREAIRLVTETARLWGMNLYTGAREIINGLINDTEDGRVLQVLEFLEEEHQKAVDANKDIEAILDITLLDETDIETENPLQRLREAILPEMRGFAFADKEQISKHVNILKKLFQRHKRELKRLIGDVQRSPHWHQADRIGEAFNYADVPITFTAYRSGFSNALDTINDMSTYFHARPEDFIALMRNDMTAIIGFDFAEKIRLLSAEELQKDDRPDPEEPKDKPIKIPDIAALLREADEKIQALGESATQIQSDNQGLKAAIETLKEQASELEGTFADNIEVLGLYIADFQSKPIELRRAFYEESSYTREDLTTKPEMPILKENDVSSAHDVAQRKVTLMISDLTRKISLALDVIDGIDDEDLKTQAASLIEAQLSLQAKADELVVVMVENIDLQSKESAYSQWFDKLDTAVQLTEQKVSWHSDAETIINAMR